MKFAILVVLCSLAVAQEAPKPETRPLNSDLKLHVLEAKSSLDDAQSARKDLEVQVQNLNTQIKQRFDTVQKEEADAQKKYDEAVRDALKTAGLKEDEWTVDNKTWTFTKKAPPQKASAAVPAPPTQK
jgi:hypothetical protein